VGSLLSMKKVPEEFRDFVEKKKAQLYANVVSSAVVGFVFANVLSGVLGEFSMDVLMDSLRPQLYVLGPVGLTYAVTLLFSTETKSE